MVNQVHPQNSTTNMRSVARKDLQEEEDGQVTLIVTEVVRWIAMIVPIYLSVWRYAIFKGFTEFLPSANCTSQSADLGDVDSECLVQFWGIVTAVILGGTLAVYTPLKCCFAKTNVKDARYIWGWRPSVLTYLILGALPCFTIILVAIQTSDRGAAIATLDPETLLAIQITVMSLTVTEWMAKFREETLSYDLIGNMATDFFFAYDVFDFFDMFLHTAETFHTNWIYVNFVFGYIAMFKYIPHIPVNLEEKGAKKKTAISILVSMICNDIPFVIIRITTMIIYGLDISDIIHPAKNIALIVFGCMQIYVIYDLKEAEKQKRPKYTERRSDRHSSLIVGPVPGVDNAALDEASMEMRDCEETEQVNNKQDTKFV